jgi:cytochrome oxidase Cu insertion factor (SCO1/SenC/PrrC family)
VPTTGDDYTVDHTTLTYLLNGKGEVIDILPYQTPPERAAEQLKRLIAAG